MKTFVYHENVGNKGSFLNAGDAWAINEKIKAFVVADSPLRCLIRDSKEYPFDDHGYEVAKTFCDSYIKNAKKFLEKSIINKSEFRKVLSKSNKEIKKLNKKLGKAYKDKENYDIGETVGIGAIIVGNNLFYGGLEDCYVNVYRGNSTKNLAQWDYQIIKAKKCLDKISADGELNEYLTKSLKSKLKLENIWEPCWCNHLRNNKTALDKNGDCVGWGCFTGEKDAEFFIQVHQLDLQRGDHVLLFSDGMIPVIDNANFIKWFFKNNKNSFNFQRQMRQKIIDMFSDFNIRDKEKTLIYYQV